MKYTVNDILVAIVTYIFAIIILACGAIWLFRWPLTALIIAYAAIKVTA